MSTAWVDEGGTVRMRGTLDPAPGGGIPTGSGSPTGVVTPSGIGALYIDTTGGALYIATGATDTDWFQVGRDANGFGLTPGVARSADGSSVVILAGVDADTPLTGNVIISDAYTKWNGGAYGVQWNGSGTDGDQSFSINLAGGSTLFLANGQVTFAGTILVAGGVYFPATDPHVANAWWDNAGTLTKSVG